MVHCHVTWDSYKNNICKGFSHLQQSEEFVDMTLAADGHLVKVHKSLLALVSPYIKEMILSAPTSHPVLFLNLVSYEVLCYILEYVYTGEVDIPANMMNKFLEATKALHIVGVCNLPPPWEKGPHLIKCSGKIPMRKNSNTAERILNKNISVNISSRNLNQDTIIESNLVNSGFNQNFETKLVNSDFNQNSETNLVNNDLNQNSETDLVNNDLNQNFEINLVNSNFNQNKETNNFVISDFKQNLENNGIQHSTSDFCIQSESEGALSYNTEIKVELLKDKTDNNNMLVEENTAPNINIDSSFISHNIESQNTKTNDILPIPIEPHLTAPIGQGNNLDVTDLTEFLSPSNNRNEQISESYNKAINQSRVNESICDDVNTVNQSALSKEYSINVVLPTTGNKKNPVITINASVLENPAGDLENIHEAVVERGAPTLQTCDLTRLPENHSPLYMKTGRDSLQMIFNRFMYYEHHKSKKGLKIRWRCIDYRSKKCPAYVDTFEEKIVNRKYIHAHPFHDEKIIKTGSRRRVFTSLPKLMESDTEQIDVEGLEDSS